jgi:hypothetical protein
MPGDTGSDAKRRKKVESLAERIGGSVPQSVVSEEMVCPVCSEEEHVEHGGGSGGAADDSSSHAGCGSEGEMGGGGNGVSTFDSESDSAASDGGIGYSPVGQGCGARGVDPSVDQLRQHRGLMKKLCGDVLPPWLRSDGNNPMGMAVFAVSAFIAATEGAKGVGRHKARLDLRRWTMPGVAKVRNLDGSARHVWFCNCCPKNVCIKRTAEALHTMAGGCSDVESASCECVQYCQSVFDKAGYDVEELISLSPKYVAPDGPGDRCHPPCTLPPSSSYLLLCMAQVLAPRVICATGPVDFSIS